jgi:DNA helicase-2/ATP-dependent DNA helicase PcrA
MPEPSIHTDDLGEVLDRCLSLDNPKSFFLFAGAGSGKTRALVKAMTVFRKKHGKEFRRSGQQVAVITYTNAACDEIKSRTAYDSVFAVSTIHSFAWELIRAYHQDIREWLGERLRAEIADLQAKQAKGRAGTKAASDRPVQIEAKTKRLERLGSIKTFAYNPNGENIGKNSVNHAEVIGLAADFLTSKPLMQRILVRKYPFVLIDESQDTQKDLVDAFFTVQALHAGDFCLCLFGDTMQRIYADGKVGLEGAVPDEWAKPSITINYRCPKRIVEFINAVRAHADFHKQEPRDDAPKGFVRLFLVQDGEDTDKAAIEAQITKMMATITSDERWSGEHADVKTLMLEHSMAARRGGFSDFFEPLYQIQRFKTGVLDGTLSGISFFSQQVLPLVKAMQRGDNFATTRLITACSPLVSPDALESSRAPLDDIRKADEAVKAVLSLWDDGAVPALNDVLRTVAASGLFAIPEVFKPIVSRGVTEDGAETVGEPAEDSDHDESIDAWDNALSASFGQLDSYVRYISDESPYGTHQGIKGLQFPRVMVVLDDNDARGFLFSYDKLLGAKPPAASDQKNASDGKETSIDRTRRLFYVTCSRAQSSLAIVVYTSGKDAMLNHLRSLQWFEDGEIIDMGSILEEDT